MSDMKRTWLVQRLKGAQRIDNPFSFGGGRRNGGLTDEAMGLLRGIFSFDYMGAAEFEFGAVPKALQGLAKDGDDLVAFAVSIPLAQVPANWRDKGAKAPEGAADVFVLCRQEQVNEVTSRIQAWSTEEYPELKESLRFTSALRPSDDFDSAIKGWLELDNGFAFFLDREMWAQTCSLFGVAVEQVAR